MALERHLKKLLQCLEQEGFFLPNTDYSAITLEPCKDPSHGDFSTNAALVLSKVTGKPPRELAQKLADGLRTAREAVQEVGIAGPGFVNIVCPPSYWWNCLHEILLQGDRYGESHHGRGEKINLEYVSANPTGPLHVGHGRVAVVADVIANLLEKVGFRVTREYYVNDIGGQIHVLARSTWLRYREALGEAVEIPPGCYPGEYLKDVADALVVQEGDRLLALPESEVLDFVGPFATAFLMQEIRQDLAALGIRQDLFVSERSLHDAGLVEQTVHALEERGLAEEGVLERPKGKEDDTWTPQPLLLFRSSLFGDDSDRPLKKTSGEWTYLAGDIAYHQNKIGRGFRHLIDVWGADHGSHVSRMQAAVKALSPETTLEIILAQIVHFIKDGQPLKISKRAGTFVTVRDVLEQLDGDVLRFLMVSRKHDSQFTLDLDHAWEHSKDNPVFYVQYAHARACSVLRMGAEMFPLSIPPDALLQAPMARLVDDAELFRLKGLADWPRQVQKAAATREPHRIVTFLYETAHRFHTLWHKGKKDATLRFLLPDDEALSLARLALMKATCAVIASGLQVLGVTAVQEMR